MTSVEIVDNRRRLFLNLNTEYIEIQSSSMVLTSSTVGHNLHYYKVIYYCISFIPPGLAFIVFPSLAIMLHCCLSPKMNKKPTESDGDDNLIHCEFEKCIHRFKYDKMNNSSYSCCRNCAEFLLNLTIATSQFLFGVTNVQLKDKISYKERCVKIGRGYYKLSFYTLLPLVWCNACVLASLIAVFCAFSIFKETNNCDKSLDCFLADESDTRRITNCSMFHMQRKKVKCYEVYFQPLYALVFIGGLLKFVPILFRATILLFLNEFCKKINCRKHRENVHFTTFGKLMFYIKRPCSLEIIKIILILIILSGIFVLFCLLLFKHPIHAPGLDFIQVIMPLKKLGLSMAVIAQILAIFIYPWLTLIKNGYVIKQIDLKIILDEHKDQICKHHSRSSGSPNQESSELPSTDEPIIN